MVETAAQLRQSLQQRISGLESQVISSQQALQKLSAVGKKSQSLSEAIRVRGGKADELKRELRLLIGIGKQIDVESIPIAQLKKEISIRGQAERTGELFGRERERELRAGAAERKIRQEAGVGPERVTVQEISAKRIIPGRVVAKPGPGIVNIAPTNLEQLQRQIKLSTPELAFLPDARFKRVLQGAIGQAGGLLQFSRKKFIGELTSIRGAGGGFIFTQGEAERIGGLTFDIATNVGLGAGVGKTLTLTRGGFLSALPATVARSKTLQKVVKLVDATVLTGLSVVEVNRLRQVAEVGGSQAVVRELINLISFGAGFSKTGLAGNPQARAEFQKAAKALRDFGPKGRKGQISIILRKKRKKGELSADFRDFEIEDVIASLGALEKRIAGEKTLAGQLKILAEVKKNLKTKRAVTNFNDFVQSLIDKELIRPVKLQVTKAGKIELPAIRKPAKTSVELRNRQRVEKNQVRNRQRQVKATTTLGQRYKDAQLKKSKTKSIALQINTARVALTTLIGSKATSASILKQRSKLTSLQTQRSRQLGKQQSRQKQVQRQVQRTRLRLTNRQVARQKATQRHKTFLTGKVAAAPKFPKFPVFPLPFKKKTVKKKKVSKKGIADAFVGGHNVFVKAKGKFQKVNLVPLKKSKADDLGSFLADKSTARTFRVKPVKQEAKKPRLKVPASYFAKNKNKFRGMKVKGKIQKFKPFTNKIEKRKFAIDSRGEKKQLSLARVRAKLVKKFRSTKKK